ncbi:MAG: glucose-6-phosphate isomerase [Coprobacillus sp.]|nr:glucose-6-phosphate isomerase [Coprobacillus sp.]
MSNTKKTTTTKKGLTLHLENAVDVKELKEYSKRVKEINEGINNKTLRGNDFLGWSDYPKTYNKAEVEQIIQDAKYVRENYDVLVVCGIGGSYLGARAVIEALTGIKKRDGVEIIFFGNTFSPNYAYQVLDYIKDKRFAINVISKSGTTTETSVAFRLVKGMLEQQVGKKAARKAIFATTDKEKGALKEEATKEGYRTYVLPDDVGGRYSVFTAVGLFPMAVAGINIKTFLTGARKAMKDTNNGDLKTNPCYQYACTRDYMLNHGKSVEMFVSYELQYTQIAEWLKQLFGESEGKEKKGLFPASGTFSTDLHSLGQFIQEGTPLLFETIIYVNKPKDDVIIPKERHDLDGLNYLKGQRLSYVNRKAFEGTLEAHTSGGVPCVVIELEKLDAYNMGYLLYFFMRAVAMSAYLLDVNPFDQPGVEIYKKNMFHLLGKKGY